MCEINFHEQQVFGKRGNLYDNNARNMCELWKGTAHVRFEEACEWN